jgi:hypothetical protein
MRTHDSDDVLALSFVGYALALPGMLADAMRVERQRM